MPTFACIKFNRKKGKTAKTPTQFVQPPPTQSHFLLKHQTQLHFLLKPQNFDRFAVFHGGSPTRTPGPIIFQN